MIQKCMVRVIPFLVAWLLRLWFSTCRVSVYGGEHRSTVDAENKSVIAIFWHFSLVYIFYHLRTESAAVLVSASEDGDYIAGLAKNLTVNTVRGSRNRRGLRALKELIDCLKAGEHVGIVADGSQGPPLIVQPGAILMASKTGSPILPMSWAASRYLSFRSWDRTALPLPFSRIHFHYGPPVYIPAGVDGAGIEEYRELLEREMKGLYRKAWSAFEKEGH